MRGRIQHEADKETFNANAYQVNSYRGVAWHVLGWEVEPDEDTEWSGIMQRTGKVVAVMVGDDRKHTFEPDELTPLGDEDYCPSCGQTGCQWH